MIALTGTPGTGKTTVAELLKKRGHEVISVLEMARKHGCILDEEGDEVEIDVERLANFRFDGIVEGHLSHYLHPDITIVLRCNPLILKERLADRGWDEEKLMENVEAELLDVILVEAIEMNYNVFEVDTTSMTPEEVADVVENIISGEGEEYRPGRVDWLSELGDRLDEVMRKV